MTSPVGRSAQWCCESVDLSQIYSITKDLGLVFRFVFTSLRSLTAAAVAVFLRMTSSSRTNDAVEADMMCRSDAVLAKIYKCFFLDSLFVNIRMISTFCSGNACHEPPQVVRESLQTPYFPFSHSCPRRRSYNPRPHTYRVTKVAIILQTIKPEHGFAEIVVRPTYRSTELTNLTTDFTDDVSLLVSAGHRDLCS